MAELRRVARIRYAERARAEHSAAIVNVVIPQIAALGVFDLNSHIYKSR
jgi:hypothetical protein